MSNQHHKNQIEEELISNLIADLQHVFNTVSKENLVKLKETIHSIFPDLNELSYDDTVIDSIRQVILAKEMGCKTIGDYKKSMRLADESIEHWPEFTRTEPDYQHVTKAGQAMIMMSCIDHARKQLKK